MKDIFEIQDELQHYIDRVAEDKGFGDSYAYKYGYFHSQMAQMLDRVLTKKQIKELSAEVDRLVFRG